MTDSALIIDEQLTGRVVASLDTLMSFETSGDWYNPMIRFSVLNFSSGYEGSRTDKEKETTGALFFSWVPQTRGAESRHFSAVFTSSVGKVCLPRPLWRLPGTAMVVTKVAPGHDDNHVNEGILTNLSSRCCVPAWRGPPP